MNYVPANNWWLGDEQYNLLWGSGGHPGNATDAVRQWRAPQAGTIRITGSAADGNYACGDGVIVSIQKGAEVLWQQTILNGNTSGFAYDITVAVAAGEQINFVINKRANYDCDSTNFDPTRRAALATTSPAGIKSNKTIDFSAWHVYRAPNFQVIKHTCKI